MMVTNQSSQTISTNLMSNVHYHEEWTSIFENPITDHLHLFFHENEQTHHVYDVYLKGTDRIGKHQARYYRKHPDKMVQMINHKDPFPQGQKITVKDLK